MSVLFAIHIRLVVRILPS